MVVILHLAAPSNTATPAPTSTAVGTTSSITPTSVSVTVKSSDLSGNSFTGQWVTLRDANGTIIATGFTPATFNVTPGAQYTVHAANFQNFVFNHWDDESTNSWRTNTTTHSPLVSYYIK